MTTTTATRADVCVAAVADAFADSGEVLGHAVGIVPAVGVRLAKLTSNPDLALSDGEAFMMSEPPPLLKTASAGGTIEAWVPFRSIFDILASGRRHSMMGASQVDRYGNQNISSIGDWRRPKKQLIGVRGAPGNTVNHRVDYWVAKHTARVFVDRVDVASGVGNDRAKARGDLRFHDLGVVITNLAVLSYDDQGLLRVKSLHPGVTPEEVQEATGFPIDASTTEVTRTPTPDEQALIDEIDPKGLRHKEVPA